MDFPDWLLGGGKIYFWKIVNLTTYVLVIKKREHISLVVDKSDVPIGIVTLEDIIETILGYEIVDETDMVDDMQVLAKKISSQKNKE